MTAIIKGFLISNSCAFAVGLGYLLKQDVVVVIGCYKVIFDISNKDLLVLAFLVNFFEQELLFALSEEFSSPLSTRKLWKMSCLSNIGRFVKLFWLVFSKIQKSFT